MGQSDQKEVPTPMPLLSSSTIKPSPHELHIDINTSSRQREPPIITSPVTTTHRRRNSRQKHFSKDCRRGSFPASDPPYHAIPEEGPKFATPLTQSTRSDVLEWPLPYPYHQYILTGKSRAAWHTSFVIPQLNLLLDAGLCVNQVRPRHIFLTHGHSDHTLMSPAFVRRDLKPDVFCPAEMSGVFDDFILANTMLNLGGLVGLDDTPEMLDDLDSAIEVPGYRHSTPEDINNAVVAAATGTNGGGGCGGGGDDARDWSIHTHHHVTMNHRGSISGGSDNCLYSSVNSTNCGSLMSSAGLLAIDTGVASMSCSSNNNATTTRHNPSQETLSSTSSPSSSSSSRSSSPSYQGDHTPNNDNLSSNQESPAQSPTSPTSLRGHAWLNTHRTHPMHPGTVLPLPRLPNIIVTAFPCDHTVPCLGYLFSTISQRLKPQYRGLSGQQIRELRESGTGITYTYNNPMFAFLGDTTVKPLREEPWWLKDDGSGDSCAISAMESDPSTVRSGKGADDGGGSDGSGSDEAGVGVGAGAGAEEESVVGGGPVPVVITECSFLYPEHKEHADRTKHTVWCDLEPIVYSHPKTIFVLMHFSMRYNDEDIRSFFNGLVDAPGNIVVWVDGGEEVGNRLGPIETGKSEENGVEAGD